MLVTNTNDHQVILHSHCGNSVPIGPKARRLPVANKFNWQVPAGVIVEDTDAHERVDPTHHVRGKPLKPLMRAPTTVAEAHAAKNRGIHPHQSPAARAAAKTAAAKILADQRGKSETSVEALRAGVEPQRLPRKPEDKPADQPRRPSEETPVIVDQHA